MLAVFVVFPCVDTTVCPSVGAEPIHIIFNPIALVGSSVQPFITAATMDLVFKPLPGILRSICPQVATLTVLATALVVAFVPASINPLL
jgi:hypothetical protein